ncbi:MAG: DUF4139 domain-containing protein [Myxococcota bacterium]
MSQRTFMQAVCTLAMASAAASAVASAAAQPLETTAEDRRDVIVTIYNDNRGLVREVRRVQLPAGRFELQFADVADKIIAPSVHMVSKTDPRAVDVVEQNYRFDVLTPSKLMDRAEGTDITFVRENPATGEETRVQAHLLAHERGSVFKVGNEIVIGDLGRPVFSELPPSFVPRPTLVWSLENRAGARAHDLETAYLTSGMSWQADYVAVMSADDTKSSLNGWVTIDNRSGAAFDQARLALVAGNVHRGGGVEDDDYQPVQRRARGRGGAFTEESLLDYHLYTLGRATEIRDKEQKQIALMAASDVPVTKVLRLVGHPSLRGSPDPLQENLHPSVYVELRNDVASNLGMALPMGTVRVYKADKSGGQQFIGEDRIGHTPPGEKLSLLLGESFDVVAERRSVDFKALSRDLTEATYEVKVKNHKEEKVSVQIEETFAGDWELLEAAPTRGEKLDARRQRFTVEVPADGEVVLKYKVRARFD